MKLKILCAVATLLVFGALWWQGAWGLEVGSKAPNFSLTDLRGEKVSLSDFLGKKVVVLNFWGVG